MSNDFEMITNFIRIRQEKIDEIVEATKAGLDVRNIDLSYMELMSKAKESENELFQILETLKEDTLNEQEKGMMIVEFQKLLESESQAK